MKIQIPSGSVSVVTLLFLLLGAGLTGHGLVYMDWAAFAGSRWHPALRLMEVWAVLAAVIAVASLWRNVSPLLVGGVLVAMAAIAAGAIWPLLAVLLLGLACFALGRVLFSLRLSGGDSVSGVECLLAGAVIFGSVIGLLAHLPVNYPGVYGFLFLAPLLLGWRHVRDALRPARTPVVATPAADRHLVLVQSAVVAMALVHFLVSLMPEVGHDALASHLFIPAHLAWRHQWGFDAGLYVWAVMPMLGDWIYAAGYMFAGEAGSRLVNVACMFVLAWLVRDVALWAGSRERGACWAVLLLLTTPLVFTESSSLFIESVWASLVVGGTLAILRIASNAGKPDADIILAGILLAGALAAKAVTFTVLPVLLAVLLFAARHWLKSGYVRAIIVGLVSFVAIGAIPYLTAWLATGNPVFPFFNGYFQSPFYPATNFEAPGIFERGMTWDVLYRVVFQSEKFLEGSPGAAGFQWLLLVIPTTAAMLMAWHRRGLLLLVVGAAAAWLTFEQTAYLRYVLPTFALVAAAAGVALGSLFSVRRPLERAGYVVAGLAVLLNFAHLYTGTYYGAFDPRVLVSASARDDYLATRIPIRKAVDLVNAINRQDSPVAFFSPPMTAGLHSDALYANWYNFRFEEQVRLAPDASAFGVMLARNQVQFVVLDENWGDEKLRASVRGVSTPVAEFGPVSVRVLGSQYRYAEELLSNTGFDVAAGWELVDGARLIPGGGVAVTVTSPAYQAVPVVGGRGYRLNVTARCLDRPAAGRLQVNWVDASSAMVRTDIQVFDCKPGGESHAMEVRAPKAATTAIVYATGHTSDPLVFSSVSFRY